MVTMTIIAVLLAMANADGESASSEENSNMQGFRDIKYGLNGGGYVEGFVSHGPNNFNGERIVDFTNVGFGLSWNTPIYEQQVFNSPGSSPDAITANTDRDARLAMGPFFADALSSPTSPITPDPSLFNQPYYEIGTVTSTSQSIDDRVIPSSFNDVTSSNPSDLFGNAYLPASVNPNPTLGDWEQGSGFVEIDCKNGIADVKFSVCNLISDALYTVWEVGITNPGSNEGIYYLAAGGIGNVIRTDKNGNGKLNIKMAWCPIRECIPNSSKDCQIYFSIFHHSDYIVWGADLAGVFWQPCSYPAGIVGSSHLFFPLFGDEIDASQPLNRYDRSGRCRS